MPVGVDLSSNRFRVGRVSRGWAAPVASGHRPERRLPSQRARRPRSALLMPLQSHRERLTVHLEPLCDAAGRRRRRDRGSPRRGWPAGSGAGSPRRAPDFPRAAPRTAIEDAPLQMHELVGQRAPALRRAGVGSQRDHRPPLRTSPSRSPAIGSMTTWTCGQFCGRRATGRRGGRWAALVGRRRMAECGVMRELSGGPLTILRVRGGRQRWGGSASPRRAARAPPSWLGRVQFGHRLAGRARLRASPG